MKMEQLCNLSDYLLLRQLLYDGKAGIDSELEPIPIDEIVLELEHRFDKVFKRDVQLWLDWISCSTEILSEEERNSLLISHRLLEAENKFNTKNKKND